MKKSLFLLLLGLPFGLVAQIQGNFKRSASENVQSQELNPYRGNRYSQQQLDQGAGGGLSANLVGENVVEFHINALGNQKADSYTAIFNVVQLGKTADEANTALKNRLDPLLSDMKVMGIPAEDVYIDMVNFLPKFEYDVSKKLFSKKTFTEIPIGFELQKNIHVRFVNPAVLDQIVAAAAKYEIYDIVTVDYFVKDPRSVYTKLRAASLDYLKEIKNAYKGVLALDSAYTITGENAYVTYPGERYKSYQAFSSQSLDASQRSDAKVERADKPVSQFYDAIPANDYDIVLNPEILEPCVQFSYQLTVRYTLKERVKATQVRREKEFLWVTPSGDIKTLKVD